MNVQFALEQYVSKSAAMNANLSAPNDDLPSLLSIAKACGITALNNVSGGRSLNIDLHASGLVRSVASAGLSPQNENVLFCKVEMSYRSICAKPAIPLYLHDVASRPAVKASLRRKNHAALTAPGRDAGDRCR
jgi:hypothetical protein